MKKELDERLCREFPLLYHDRRGDPGKTCMVWGFPGDGWFAILHELSSGLEPLIAAQPDGERACASQVKEKFGGLRFYMDGPTTKEMAQLVREAERKATTTCEQCGVRGESCTVGGWIKVLCPWCHAQRVEKMKERFGSNESG